MSLMGMKRAVNKHAPWIVGVIAVTMLVGVVFTGFGANLGGGGPARPNARAEAEKPVATVGGIAVTRGALERQITDAVRQQSQTGSPTPTPLQLAQMRVQSLDSYKQVAALTALAKTAGITPTDADIKAEREKAWAQQRGQFAATLGLKATATDAQISDELTKQNPGASLTALKENIAPDDKIRDYLLVKGLQNKYKSEVKADEALVRRSYDDIRVRHILIKSGEGALPDGQAKAKAEKILAEVKANPAKMPALAKQFSDDPGSKNKGGLYEWAPAAQYVAAFSDAALEAGVGKVYPEPVKTQFGYHVIKSEGMRTGKDFPKDFDKNKQKYIDQYTDKLASQKLQEAVTTTAATIPVQITDPALLAGELQQEAGKLSLKEARDAKLNQALAQLAKVDKKDDPSGTVPLQEASIYEALGKPTQAIAAYTESLEYSNSVETRLALANLYLSTKDNKNAVAQLEKASELAIPDVQTQFRLAFMLKQAGRNDLATKAQGKAQEMMQRQMAAQQKSNGGLPAGLTAPTLTTKPGRTKVSVKVPKPAKSDSGE